MSFRWPQTFSNKENFLFIGQDRGDRLGSDGMQNWEFNMYHSFQVKGKHVFSPGRKQRHGL